ncbi:MAG: hypothetical protein C4288_02140 [Leptolyngbya sp. ERB_1_1]
MIRPVLQVLQSMQELDEAVRSYIATDWQGEELYQRWQAIRDASLSQLLPEFDPLQVPGEDSY